MRTTASRGLRIFGSGTLSTWTFPLPSQHTAFMVLSSSVCKASRGRQPPDEHHLNIIRGLTPPARRCRNACSTPAGTLALHGRDLAGLHQLFEPAQVVADLLARLLAEHPGDGRAEPSARRV